MRQNPGRVETVDFPCVCIRRFVAMILTILRLPLSDSSFLRRFKTAKREVNFKAAGGAVSCRRTLRTKLRPSSWLISELQPAHFGFTLQRREPRLSLFAPLWKRCEIRLGVVCFVCQVGRTIFVRLIFRVHYIKSRRS